MSTDSRNPLHANKIDKFRHPGVFSLQHPGSAVAKQTQVCISTLLWSDSIYLRHRWSAACSIHNTFLTIFWSFIVLGESRRSSKIKHPIAFSLEFVELSVLNWWECFALGFSIHLDKYRIYIASAESSLQRDTQAIISITTSKYRGTSAQLCDRSHSSLVHAKFTTSLNSSAQGKMYVYSGTMCLPVPLQTPWQPIRCLFRLFWDGYL